MLEPAAALNRAGESVALNLARMERISSAYGVSDARVAVMPNMVLAAGGRGIPAALEFSRERPFGNRLDHTAAIADMARDAEHASIDPDDGLRRLDEIDSMPHPLRRRWRHRRAHGPDDRALPDPPSNAGGARHAAGFARSSARSRSTRLTGRPSACCSQSLPPRSSAHWRSVCSPTRRSTARCAC
jgi:hypothetical protein